MHIINMSSDLYGTFEVLSPENYQIDSTVVTTAEALLQQAINFAHHYSTEIVTYDFYSSDQAVINSFYHSISSSQEILPANLCLNIHYVDGNSSQMVGSYKNNGYHQHYIPSSYTYDSLPTDMPFYFNYPESHMYIPSGSTGQIPYYYQAENFDNSLPYPFPQNLEDGANNSLITMSLEEQISKLSFSDNNRHISEEIKAALAAWQDTLTNLYQQRSGYKFAEEEIQHYVEKTQNVIQSLEKITQPNNSSDDPLNQLQNCLKSLEDFAKQSFCNPTSHHITAIEFALLSVGTMLPILSAALSFGMIFQPWLAIPLAIVLVATLAFCKVLHATEEAVLHRGIPKDAFSQGLARFGWFNHFPSVQARSFTNAVRSSIETPNNALSEANSLPLSPVYLPENYNNSQVNLDPPLVYTPPSTGFSK